MTNTDPAPAPTGRPTRQRRAVTAALEVSEEFRTAQELHAAIRKAGDNVGLATVYRHVQALAEAGQVDVLRTETGETAYRQCSTSHHHHLVCRACGATVEVEGPTVERWTDAVAAEHGFTDVSHTLEIFGICAACG